MVGAGVTKPDPAEGGALAAGTTKPEPEPEPGAGAVAEAVADAAGGADLCTTRRFA